MLVDRACMPPLLVWQGRPCGIASGLSFSATDPRGNASAEALLLYVDDAVALAMLNWQHRRIAPLRPCLRADRVPDEVDPRPKVGGAGVCRLRGFCPELAR